MQTLHLFAGAGGGLLGDLILGHTPIGAVEFDPYCCRVLRERAADGWFPGLRVHEGDVRLFDPSDYAGRVDCLHAGFPCQPHSVAGKREGEADERNLWPDTRRIIGQLRPRFVLLENVPGIVSNGYAAVVVGELSALWYDCRWAIISAADAGAPHRRERWWCLAERADTDEQRRGEAWQLQPGAELGNGRLCEVVADASSTGRQQIAGSAHGDEGPHEGRTALQADEPECDGERRRAWHVADSNLNPRHERRTSNCPQEPGRRNADRGGECASVPDTILERLERQREGGAETWPTHGPGHAGNPGWWQVEPGVGRVVDGLAARVDRLKALGNGQVGITEALAWRILGGP